MPPTHRSDLQVVVLGSANLDLRLRVPGIPRPGETVLADDGVEGVGGKGLNQAVAAARAGASTGFIAAVGADAAGARVRAVLEADGIDTVGLRTLAAPTGRAIVSVDPRGENAIVVAPGANRLLGLDDAHRRMIEGAGVLVAQLEVPVALVASAADTAHSAGVPVILNAAPAQTLERTLLDRVDVLVVNLLEARTTGGCGPDVPLPDVVAALLALVPCVVVTLGEQGSVYADRDGGRFQVAAVPVTAKDTTAAGDTFVGAFVAMLAAREPVHDALRFASSAAAVAVTRDGAVDSIPTSDEISRPETRDEGRDYA